MDDTTRLVSELLDKLRELNYKVCNYRQGLAEEFQRYSRHLLHDVPEHISTCVGEVIAKELRNYPALSPEFALHAAFVNLGGPATYRSVPSGRVSPPPALPPTPLVPGSPTEHGRECELHGLFTPSYLPLLEVVKPNNTMPAPITAPSPTTPKNPESKDTPEPSRAVQLNNSTPPQPNPTPPGPEPTLPNTPVSEGGIRVLTRRRSALRRSSSSSTKGAQSPRRVRFDVEGEEVLPTTSPPTPALVHSLPISPPPEGQPMSIHQPISHIIFDEETSLLGDSPPPPKKISSTERLRALAKNSTEDVSKWTVIGDPQDDDDDEEEGLTMFSSKSSSKAPASGLAAAPTIFANGTSHHYGRDGLWRYNGREMDEDESSDDSEADDDVLELPPFRSAKGNPRFASHGAVYGVLGNSPDSESNASKSKSNLSGLTKPSRPSEISSSEEAMFGFDEEWNSAGAEKQSNYFDEELDDEEQTVPFSKSSASRRPGMISAMSPGMMIPKPASPPPTSPAASVSRQSGVSGSYKGKPFVIGVVRDEELYKKAAVGDVGMFVGSVDGRSGVDPSVTYFADGTPQSLGKRLLEEAHLRRRKSNADREEK
ncbi:hypothetical protein GGR50DRAFT_539374 [Xylaria sp. CBS 124048]|nr:hypothetical protein GGR50DRAFT_539374 [Xylaria sp. CBS 124048]